MEVCWVMAIGVRGRLRPVVGGLQEGGFRRRKGEPRAGGTGRYKGEKVKWGFAKILKKILEKTGLYKLFLETHLITILRPRER